MVVAVVVGVGWVRSLPRGLSGSPSRREEARSPPVKPDKGEASLWRNKSSLGLKSAMTGGRSPNATHHLLDLGYLFVFRFSLFRSYVR
jgi:hypothetical protein